MKEELRGTMAVYLVGAVYIALGAMFQFVPKMKPLQLCYLLAICLLLIGIIKVAEYFIRECYRNSAQYGFSMGVMAIVLGVCVIARVQEFVDVFYIFLGIGILITAVVKLQHALDLRAMKDRGYVWVLVVAVLMILTAAVILLDPFPTRQVQKLVTYIALMADGVLTIATTTYLLIRTRQRARQPVGLELEGMPKGIGAKEGAAKHHVAD